MSDTGQHDQKADNMLRQQRDASLNKTYYHGWPKEGSLIISSILRMPFRYLAGSGFAANQADIARARAYSWAIIEERSKSQLTPTDVAVGENQQYHVIVSSSTA